MKPREPCDIAKDNIDQVLCLSQENLIWTRVRSVGKAHGVWALAYPRTHHRQAAAKYSNSTQVQVRRRIPGTLKAVQHHVGNYNNDLLTVFTGRCITGCAKGQEQGKDGYVSGGTLSM